jgi:hypothetical protein
MFESIKAKLSALEGDLRGALAGVRAEIGRLEASARSLGRGPLAPLDEAKAALGRAESSLAPALAPLKQRAASLRRPGP